MRDDRDSDMYISLVQCVHASELRGQCSCNRDGTDRHTDIRHISIQQTDRQLKSTKKIEINSNS